MAPVRTKRPKVSAVLLEGPHRDAWRAEAEALAWPPSDVEGLASLLAIPGPETRVVRVQKNTIDVVQMLTLKVRGTDRDGGLQVHEIRRSCAFRWKRTMPPLSISATRETDAIPWCAIHGNRCAGTARSCVASLDKSLCARAYEGTWKAPTGPAQATATQQSAPPPVPVTPRRRPETRRKGSPLPGQRRFDL